MEQQNPTRGKQSVVDKARSIFNYFSNRQEKKGIEKYGVTLQTWNGRDQWRDVFEEYVDLGHYIAQVRLQYKDLIRIAKRIIVAVEGFNQSKVNDAPSQRNLIAFASEISYLAGELESLLSETDE